MLEQRRGKIFIIFLFESLKRKMEQLLLTANKRKQRKSNVIHVNLAGMPVTANIKYIALYFFMYVFYFAKN